MTSNDINKENIPEPEKSKEIFKRKEEHIKIPIEYDVQHVINYFDDIKLIHHAIPEVDLDDIDLTFKFFTKQISAPICISAITGGHPLSKEINEILAKAAEEENIIMSVGSQRIGLEDPSTIDSFKIVRECAPTIPVIGNLGLGQVGSPYFQESDLTKCINMVKADVMAIHLNALHELVQDKGNVSYRNFRLNFKKVRKATDIPLIAKEVGSGINQNLAVTLDGLGFDGFDVGGSGGTSFAAIESKRNNFDNSQYSRNPADVFREWGIPTPVSIVKVREVSRKIIIATGGLRTGVDIAKSIALGADVGGFAFKFLKSSWQDRKNKTISNTLNEIRTLKKELRSTLWLLNLKNVSELKNNREKYVILGKLYQWLNQ
ncbi:MAG: type 2 isopentenyl-diphosphate Delta-isomerase [Candidatus Hermodarchaeota archaeon]